ncbi:hypothetical protein B0H17DRAFT_1093865 [Mycena rosella]|uniref:MYND-type domain-containing protein n=1 Tax=Mycena rosella TaxID=1033263 RepID=A0AAD7G3A2_MYCRO|nr:hypothetical protein B0H17DRAFT_1093865 [Mycena rosella]
MPAQPTEICENCTVNRIDLRRCAGCSVVRYCSKECQKAHWKAHKPYCVSNAELARQAAELGPDYSDSLTAIGKWCDAFSVPIGAASASALNLMNYPERIDDFVLVIYVDFLGPSAKAPHTHDIVDADVLPLDALLAHARGILLDKAAIFERNLAPRPGMIRVLLRDRRYPWSYTTPFVVPRNIREWLYDPLWFEHLQICVTRPGRPVRPRDRGDSST